jgi:phosphocarrier protein HPr
VTARRVTVRNALGLHARAAARFVKLAGSFQCQIRVTRGARTMDGKSILGLLLLAAARGSELAISGDGVDEVAAVDALCGLVDRNFEDP